MRRLRGIWTLGLLDLRLVASERAALVWMFALPVTLMWVFGNAFSTGGDRDRARVSLGVAVEDEGFLGELFVKELAGENVDLQPMKDGKPVEDTTDAGDAAEKTQKEPPPRVLTIPADFTARVLAGERVDVTLAATEEAGDRYDQMAQLRIWEGTIAFLTNLLQTERKLGVTLVREAADGDSAAAAGAPAPAIVLPDDLTADAVVERYQEVRKDARMVTVSAKDTGRGEAVPGGFAQSVPGIMTQSILMMTIIYGSVFLALEKASGALKRQGTLPVSRLDVLAGKLWGRLLLALLQAAILMVTGSLLFHTHWGPSPAGLAILVVSLCACCAAFGLLGGALFRSPEQAGSVGWIIPLVMAALGGCWWPIELVPDWMQMVGHLSPAAWAMDGFHSLISFGRGAESILLPSCILLAFGAAALAIGARTLRWE
jgi:ABC-type Na+ efflux pump permease subunit